LRSSIALARLFSILLLEEVLFLVTLDDRLVALLSSIRRGKIVGQIP